ncbi:MAG: hypothetical protein ACXABI_11070 [Candidatus Hodarchaeales archaeon]
MNEKTKTVIWGFLGVLLGVLLINILWIVLELVTSGSLVSYLISLSYTGRFHPTMEHIILRTLYVVLRAIPWYLAFIAAIIITRSFQEKPSDEIEPIPSDDRFSRMFNHYFGDKVRLYNRGIPIIAVVLLDIWLFITTFTRVGTLNISYINQLPAFTLAIFNDIIFTLFIILIILLPLKIADYRLSGVEASHQTTSGLFEESRVRVYIWILGLVAGGFFVILNLHGLINSIHNFGESFYSGEAILITFVIMLALVLIEVGLILLAVFIPLDKFGLVDFERISIPSLKKIRFRSLLTISVVLLTVFTVAQPVIESTPTFNTNQTAFSRIQISDDPIQQYPVNLSQIRFVSSDLARDISKASPPSPPKPYALSIMDDRDMVGMIDGRPAWIIPMKYSSQFNPKANVIAGSVRVFLDDPIPEHIQIKFHEMDYGWGLNGYNDISYLALQIMPDAFIGSDGISFIDPYGALAEPVWILRMSKYNDWGLEIPAGCLVIKSDGSYEKLTVQEAAAFDPEVLSDSVFMATADRAGNYIRTNQATGEFEFDFSSRGLFTVPASPDRFINIGFDTGFEEDNFYLRPHHYLINEGNWFGRIYYRKTTTSNIENVIAVAAENNTMTVYDLRQYERGGLRGVHTPDDVMDDLEEEFAENLELGEGETLANYRIRQPTLYKTKVDNDTVLVWVSLIIYRKQGADELRGALFVDAANTRIVGYTTRSTGEASTVFKQRLTSNIELTYQTLTVNDTAGETKTAFIQNGTVLYHDWIGQDSNLWKIYVLRIWDNNESKEWRILVRKKEALNGQVYAMAASAVVGEHYSFSLREDKDEQVYILYDMSVI